MTKYVVSGYIGFDNFGDEAIQKVLTDELKNKGAEKITLISSNPAKTSRIYNVESCGMFNFIQPIKESDVLISGGGSLLQDVTSLKSLLYYLSVIYTAFMFNKKVEIYAQGIGPINSKIGIFLTKFALKHVSKISVRDIESQKLLESWNIESELIDDPVFKIKIEPKNIKGNLGVQLRNFKNLNESFLKEIAKEIKDNFSDKKIIIFSLQDSIDLPVANKFKNILNEFGIESEIKSSLDINNVTEEISKLEYLIGMRFHANVIAILAGVKTLGINYDPKVKQLAEKYNFPIINLNQKNIRKEFEILKQL